MVAGLVVLVGVAALLTMTGNPPRQLSSFRSYADLSSFLDRARTGGYGEVAAGFGDFGVTQLPPPGAEAGLSRDYSGTNVQVEGVDEMDIVKTDGTYLYVASEDQVVIIRAYPASEMAVVARIAVRDSLADREIADNIRVVGLFVDGDRLVVIASLYGWYRILEAVEISSLIYPPDGTTYVLVYDLSAVEQPILSQQFEISGRIVTARMVSPFAYVITNEYIRQEEGIYVLPKQCEGSRCANKSASQIYYDPSSRDAGFFTNVLAFHVREEQNRSLSFVTGHASTLYMSQGALYISYFKWQEPTLFDMGLRSVTTWTTIYKIRVSGIVLDAVANADVAGTLLNQFSLDEHAGYLRVATTAGLMTDEGFVQQSNVYILDADLRLVGSLTGLAPGEHIYSARFIGDRAYLVTFQKIDPFFVIDLSDPFAPKVLGYLKIPGYSDYLHPFDEDHILGLGKDAVPAENGNFSWYQGLKLSLFGVADVEYPEEVARYGIGDRGTESEALHDHKAFLFIPSRGLIVIPVTLAIIDPSKYPDPLPPHAYGDIVWQGAYVLTVNLEEGFRLAARISHVEDGNASDPHFEWDSFVRRSFYIEENLYTVSHTTIKANAFADFAEVGSVVYKKA